MVPYGEASSHHKGTHRTYFYYKWSVHCEQPAGETSIKYLQSVLDLYRFFNELAIQNYSNCDYGYSETLSFPTLNHQEREWQKLKEVVNCDP